MSVLTFLIVFVLTLFLQRWLHQHIQGFGLILTGNPRSGLRLLFYLLLPGVILHELSHYLVAKLLFVPTGKFHIGLRNLRARQVTLGSVSIERVDPLRESLIGAAPFIFGVGAIWMIAAWGFDVWHPNLASVGLMLQRIVQYADDWTTWLDVYLVFAVSTAMIPSESDRAPWGPVLTMFSVIVACLFVLGWTPTIPADWMLLARQVLDALTFALGLAVVINGAVAIIVGLLEMTFGGMRGKRVAYRVRRR
jgi:hypothetical protein